MSLVLVFDLGTTNLKASVFDDSGVMRGLVRRGMPGVRDERGRHEIDPDTLIDALCAMTGELIADGVVASEIDGISFSTQTNSFLLLDEKDEPLTPIIVWDDRRAVDMALPEVDGLYGVTGVPELSGEFMVGKLAWLRAHEPEFVSRTARLCLISDYLTLWLAGVHVTEGGAAGLTGLLNIHQLEWHVPALEAYGVPASWLAAPVCAGTDVGAVTDEAAEGLGVGGHCRVVVGCLDQYAGAIGAGTVVSGGISETTGTVLATVQCADRFEMDEAHGVFVGPGWEEDVYFRMLFSEMSGRLLDVYRDALDSAFEISELDELAGAVGEDSEGRVESLMGLSGSALVERVHEMARDSEVGLGARVILEAVGGMLYRHVVALAGDVKPKGIVCVGGGARSVIWRQMKANMLGVPTVALDCAEPTSLGAAILGFHGLTGEPVSELVQRMVRRASPLEPDANVYNAYGALRARIGDK